MSGQWSVVHARLVSLLPTLWQGVTVYDGPQVTGNVPVEYVTVGFAELEESAGTFETEPRDDSYLLPEAGSVRCEYVISTGSTAMAPLRSKAFARMASLSAAIRTDQTLGVLSPASTLSLVVDVVPEQTTNGARLRLPFSVLYATRS